MKPARTLTALALSVALAASLVSAQVAPQGQPHRLTGWAVLPQTERTPGPTSGHFIDPNLGVVPPFEKAQPIPGWSALINNGDGTFIAMPDNGYGAKGNSADFVLGYYVVRPTLKTASDGTTTPGAVVNHSFTAFNDANSILKNGAGVDLLITADFAQYRSGSGFGELSSIPVDPSIIAGRLLTGYDFDVESIAQAADGTFWVGEEFGPFLLHFDADGTLMDEPGASVFNQPQSSRRVSPARHTYAGGEPRL